MACSISNIFSQISIDQANDLELNAESLVKNVFIGQGVKVELVKFLGTNNALGVFRNGLNDLGLDRGIVISTGEVETLANSNNDDATGSSTSNRTVKDEALAEIAGSALFDVAVIEIQFRPIDDMIGFNFVFGSEEYPEFVCSPFNDVFAFFIDGPNPAGGNYASKNIARIPDPSDPTGNTFTDFPVTINSVNNGQIGPDTLGNCQKPGESLDFSTYFNENKLSRTFTLDGFLDVFRASVAVMPCELYTLKLAIGDGFDDAYDSAVFLEAKSFSSALHSVSVDAPGVDYTMMEGCDPTIIEVSRLSQVGGDLEVSFEIVNGPNSATRGEDYTLNKNDLIIPNGQNFTKLIITPINDDISEGDEMIYFVFRNGDCFRDTVRIGILDYKIPHFAVKNDTMLCGGDKLRLDDNGDFSQLSIFEKSGQFPIGDPNRGNCRSTILVSDLDIQFLNEESFVQVCIDQLEHQRLADMEIYLVAPNGQVIELSTNNGGDGGNGDEMDQFINTCFTLDGGELINNGDAEKGPFLTTNPTYTGNFTPEQDFETFFGGFYSPVNGQWSLVIKDKDNVDLQGTLFQWSLKFNPRYSEDRSYEINGNEVIGSPIIVSSNAEIIEKVTQNYGCSFSNTSRVDFTPLPDAPIVSCANPRRNQIFLDWNDADVDEYEIKVGSGEWLVISDASEYMIDNLGLSADYIFEIRAVKNGCLGPAEQYECSTPACANSNIVIDASIPTSSGCINDGSLSLSVNSTDGPFRFQLERESNEDGIFKNLSKGIYRVFATDVYGCTFVKNVEVTGITPITLELIGKQVSCDAEIRGTATTNVSGGKGPFQYQWSNGGTESTIKKIEKGTYSVTVTDANDCVQTGEVEIEEGDIPTVEYTQVNIQCNGDPTGSIQLTAMGGQGPYEFRWKDGFATVLSERKNLTAGIYTVAVLDINRCFALAEIEITEPDNFVTTIEKEDVACFNMATGIARLNIEGGTAPYDIYWSNGETQSAIGNLKAGEYGVTLTDTKGCRTEDMVTITEPVQRLITFQEGTISCNKGENGTITAELQGGGGSFSYEWDNGRSFQTINNLSKGRYCLTVTDENGCTISDCYILDEPPAMSVELSADDITCYHSRDGSLEITVQGGRMPYTIELNGEVMNVGASGMINDLRAGTYFVKVIDATGCITSDVIEIVEAAEPSLFPEVKDLKCIGDNTGRIFMRYQNEPNAKMSWQDDQGNIFEGKLLSGLSSGNYHYEISTRSGCILSGTVIVNEPANPLKITTKATDITCFRDRNGEIKINGEGGSGKYSYSLSGAGFQRSGWFSGLKAGKYKTFVRDENNCETQGDTLNIVEPRALKVTLPYDTTINIGEDFEVIIDVENGQGELMFEWLASPDQDLSCIDCSDLFVNNINEDFLLRVKVEDDKMCNAQAEVEVFVVKDYQMYVPTGFSPNADARNERLNVFGPDYALIKEFNIYLRNGTNIYNEYDFRPNSITKGWDGTFRGKKMPSGIYIWTMHVDYDDGARESFKGSVQLIR